MPKDTFVAEVTFKVLKMCLNGKEKLRILNTISVSCKASDTAIKDVKVLKSLFKLFATLESKM